MRAPPRAPRPLALALALAVAPLSGCLDDESADPDAGAGGSGGQVPDVDGGEGGMGGTGGSGGVGGMGGAADGPFDCAAICDAFERDCPQALAVIGNCNDCEDLANGLAEAPDEPILQRAAVACERAESTGDCRAFAVCLTDDDGHNAGAPGGVSVTVTRDNGDGELLASSDAWAVVGAKGDGAPGDLEVYFEVDGTFYGIEFDDLANAADSAPLDAAEYPVAWLTAEETVDYEVGTITLDVWALDGPIDVTAAVSGEAPDTGITIHVTGTLSQ